MKKVLFLILMICCVATTSYAKVNAEVDVKGGIIASPCLNCDGKVSDVDMGFTLGLEGYIFCTENFALGPGVSYLFPTDVENTAKKINYLDFFLTAKQRIAVGGDEIDYVYFFGQVGASNADIKIIGADNKTGLYLAGGIGVQANWLLLEVIYSYRQWSMSDINLDKVSFYTVAFNIGYKFSI